MNRPSVGFDRGRKRRDVVRVFLSQLGQLWERKHRHGVNFLKGKQEAADLTAKHGPRRTSAAVLGPTNLHELSGIEEILLQHLLRQTPHRAVKLVCRLTVFNPPGQTHTGQSAAFTSRVVVLDGF